MSLHFLGAIDSSVLDPPTPCASKRTGELSDDVIGSQCINLREVDASNEVKRMIEDIAGVSTSWRSPGGIWGTGDENALLLWAEESALSDVAPLVHRTSTGWHYPTAAAIVEMLDKLGCAPSFGGPEPVCHERYPRLSKWWREDRSLFRKTVVEPPLFGAPVEPPLPGEEPPTGVRPPGTPPELGAEPNYLGPWGLLAIGAVVGAGVYVVALR